MADEPFKSRSGDLGEPREPESRLDIQEDIEHQLRAWRIQRIGWVCMALICISALLGFFSDGSVAEVSVKGGGLQVEYERFLRSNHQSELVIRTLTGKWPTSLELGSDFLEWVNIQSIQPHTDVLRATGAGLALNIAAMGDHPVLRIRFEPSRSGRHKLRLRNSEGWMVDATCLVYP